MTKAKKEKAPERYPFGTAFISDIELRDQFATAVIQGFASSLVLHACENTWKQVVDVAYEVAAMAMERRKLLP